MVIGLIRWLPKMIQELPVAGPDSFFTIPVVFSDCFSY